ncbi:unnamed protein product [Cuscuta epithymum]|uniref:RING-type domain-containing protein n=1 Tax=Cuscuta epithymum TaxID=186058 RepID=A0AAV0DCS4_9ASTE|nr:unnamed protein product [Cuscuta epithymum]
MAELFESFRLDLDIDTEDGPDLQRSVVRIYLEQGNASFARTWWLDSKECGSWNQELLYRIVEDVDVSPECAETIDLEKILSEEEDEELVTLLTDKLLSPFQNIIPGENIEYLASVLIRRCRDRLIPLTNDNSNSKRYSISVAVCSKLSIILGLKAWTWFLDCLEQLPPGAPHGYDPSSPMPLPRMVPNGYSFFQLGGGEEEEEETCAICLGKYEPQCLVIRLQCLEDILPNHEEEHSHKTENAAAMLLPCQHIFHANCIASWFRVSDDKPDQLSGVNTCPLCRRQVPSRHFVLSLEHFFRLSYYLQ